MTHPFLDLAPLSAARFAEIEDRVARLLDTRQDVVIMQGEALLPLEGAIRGTAGPGTTALRGAGEPGGAGGRAGGAGPGRRPGGGAEGRGDHLAVVAVGGPDMAAVSEARAMLGP